MKNGVYWRFSSVIFVFLAHFSSAIFQINNPKLAYNNVEATISLLGECFTQNYKSMVLDGSLNNFHLWHKRLTQKMPVNVFSSTQKEIFKYNLGYLHPYKLNETYIRKFKPLPANFFILAGSSLSSMERTLKTLQKSTWWNQEGLFVIVNENLDDYCDFADLFLLLAWKFDILSVVYLCFGYDTRLKLFTFNPFTTYRPDFWEDMGINVAHDGQEWTLFGYAHEINGSVNCDNLYFDKTISLKDYTVNVIALLFPNPVTKTIDVQSEIKRNLDPSINVIRNIWTHLGVTANVTYTNVLEKIDDNGHTYGTMKDLLNGIYDVGHDERYNRDHWKMETYPHSTAQFCFLTHYQGSESKLSHILSIFAPKLWFVIFLSVIFSAVLLKCLVRRSFVWAFLHVLRFLLGVAILWRPTLPHARIVFMCFAFLLLMMNSLFVTHLSSMLSVSTAKPNINDVFQLEKAIQSGLPLYCDKANIQFLRNPIFAKYYQQSDLRSCYTRIRRGERVACMERCNFVRKLEHVRGVTHFARHGFAINYLTFNTRKNWPLQTRVNMLIRRLVEGGLINKIRSKRFDLDVDKRIVDVVDRTVINTNGVNVNYQKLKRAPGLFIDIGSIKVDQLSFNFCLLAIGILCASVVFAAELITYRSNHRCFKRNRIFA